MHFIYYANLLFSRFDFCQNFLNSPQILLNSLIIKIPKSITDRSEVCLMFLIEPAKPTHLHEIAGGDYDKPQINVAQVTGGKSVLRFRPYEAKVFNRKYKNYISA